MTARSGARFADALRITEFRSLWAAEAVSVAGDQLARVALALLIYTRTSSALLTAITYALPYLPAILGRAAPLARLADRYPRRRVLLAADLVRAGLAAAMALPNLPNPALWILLTALSAAGRPARAAPPTTNAPHAAGFILGGAAVATVGPSWAMAIAAGAFALGAILARPAPETPPNGTAPTAAAYALTGMIGLYLVGAGVAAPYGRDIGATAIGVGLLMAANPIGGMLGAWVATRLPASPAILAGCAAAAGIPLVVTGFRPGLAITVVLWSVSGALSGIVVARAAGLVRVLVSDQQRGRVDGRLATVRGAAPGLAILAGGLVADAVGPAFAVAGAGALAVVLAGFVALYFRTARPGLIARAEPEPDVLDVHQMSLLRTTDTSSQRTGERPDPAAAGDDPGGEPSGSGSVSNAGPAGDTSSFIMGHTPTKHPDRPRLFSRSAATRRSTDRQRRARSRERFRDLPICSAIFLASVEIAALVLTMALARGHPIGHRDLLTGGILAAMGVFTAECTRRVEHMRRRLTDRPHVNLTSVWTVAAAVVLPTTLTAATVVILYGHLWVRSWRTAASPAFRLLYNVSVVVLSCDAAAAIAHWTPLGFSLWPTEPTMVAAMLVVIAGYSLVNSTFAATALILLRDGRSIKGVWGSWSENCVEYATLCLGMIAAVLVEWLPWMLDLLPLPLYVLHRAILVRQLQVAATTDEKTGLYNAATWQAMLDSELERARRIASPVGVLMIDLDHLKRVTDRHGAATGDTVLRAVADAITGEVRADDICGRYGGEEFVVTLPGADLDGATAVAERICARVRTVWLADPDGEGLAVTVSIGTAAFPDAGPTGEAVVLAADTALYAAKDGGRDRVSVARVGVPSAVHQRPGKSVRPKRSAKSDSAR